MGADRKQLLLVSSAQVDQMAAQSYAKLTSEAAGRYILNADPALTQRVRRLLRASSRKPRYSAATHPTGSGKSMS